MKKYIIYGLYCPFTGSIHYVGKSTCGMTRPMQHMTNSHSEKINIWVKELKILGYSPIIKILEYTNKEDIDLAEVRWINKMVSDGEYLLNFSHNSTNKIINKLEYKNEESDILKLADFIKSTRKGNKIKTTELCKSCNISRPTLLAIEKGSKSVTFLSIRKVLDYLGYELTIKKRE